MDVKTVYAHPNGTLSILPDDDDDEAAKAAGGGSPWRPSSVPFAAAYLALSSVAIASNVMVLTGIVTTDRLRSPYAVLVSALCLQCAMDAGVGHFVTTDELLAGGVGGGGGPAMCRGVATATVALSVVELVTFAGLAAANAFVRGPDCAELALPAAAAMWAAPSAYTYVILAPTLLFSTRYFPSRGRCGFTANTTGWFYPSLLIVLSLMIPWSISFYFVLVSLVKPAGVPSAVPATKVTKHRTDPAPSKLIFASYTVLVTPGFVSSCVYLYGNPRDNPWAENEVPEDLLDGYLSKLPVLFDVLVPLILIYHHKAFRKKCRDLYLHGFRNSVSDGRQIPAEAFSGPSRNNEDRLADDAPVLFVEQSAGTINVRLPSENGFVVKVCDLNDRDAIGSAGLNRKRVVRFSRKTNRAQESGVYSTQGPNTKESSL